MQVKVSPKSEREVEEYRNGEHQHSESMSRQEFRWVYERPIPCRWRRIRALQVAKRCPGKSAGNERSLIRTCLVPCRCRNEQDDGEDQKCSQCKQAALLPMRGIHALYDPADQHLNADCEEDDERDRDLWNTEQPEVLGREVGSGQWRGEEALPAVEQDESRCDREGGALEEYSQTDDETPRIAQIEESTKHRVRFTTDPKTDQGKNRQN